MTTRQLNRSPKYRLIVLQAQADMVLLKLRGKRFCLPTVHLPIGQRFAGAVDSTLRTHWRCSGLNLFEVVNQATDGGRGLSCLFVECWDAPGPLPPYARWVQGKTLSADKFTNRVDFHILIQGFRQYRANAEDSACPLFSKPRWFLGVRAWVGKTIAAFGIELSGRFHPLNAGGLFCLLRFQTTGRAVWFKAVGGCNVREYAITLLLQTLIPEFVPFVLADRPEWNAWLAYEVPGALLCRRCAEAEWETAARSLGRLQAASIGAVNALAECGARDLRAKWLLQACGGFFEMMQHVMEEQKSALSTLGQSEISQLRDTVKEALEEIQDIGVPSALGHMDLNAGNVVLFANRAIFLDWAEAYVGLPFLSFEYLLQQFRRLPKTSPLAEARLRVVYLQPWSQLLSPRQLHRSCASAPLLAVFAYAASNLLWPDADRPQTLATHPYLCSLTRRMALEAARWKSRRVA